MARPRTFDPQDVLTKAKLLFWKQGFARTSIEDLVRETGVGRQSLYNAFGDKRQLFLAVLSRYESETASLLEPLRRRDAGLESVRDYFRQAADLQRSAKCVGCLVIKSALEMSAEDPEIRQVVQAAAQATRRALASAIQRAQSRGELASSARPKELADLLFALANGLAALQSTGAPRRELERVLELGLRLLESG